MKIGPKFKIARRLGAPIFEKTQTQKFALSLARKEKTQRRGRRPKPKSEYGLQLQEKQKARFSYGVSEKQFRSYVNKALKTADPVQKLFVFLESRLDNVLFRSGFTKTRAQGRQSASHGHVQVNGRRVTIPSIILKEGDIVGLSPTVAESPLFQELAERMKTNTIPAWLKVDPEKKEVLVTGVPVYDQTEQVFDLRSTIEFYNR